jgi:DNA modification methylase
MIDINSISKGKLINRDATNELKKIPSNSIDMAAMDPPYGYKYMGKDWDKALPGTRDLIPSHFQGFFSSQFQGLSSSH